MNTDGEGRRVSLHRRLMRDDLNSTLWGNFAQPKLEMKQWDSRRVVWANYSRRGPIRRDRCGTETEDMCVWFVWMCRTQMCHKIYDQVTQESVRYFKSSIRQLNNWTWWTEVSWTFFRNTLNNSSEPFRKWHQPLCHLPAGPLKTRLSISATYSGFAWMSLWRWPI